MGVYIKGFPLPNNCGACPLRLAWCRERIYMVTRPERCPLVPVPEHGDLIDREATMGKIGHLADEIDKKLGYEKSAPYIMMTLYLTNVDDFPSIIPADKEGEG